MQVAIFSDVHGNLTALEAVWQDIQEQEPDLIVFAGDLCLFGPRPKACLDFIRERDDEVTCVYGNTDEWIDGPPLLSDDIEEEERQRHQTIHNIVEWTSAELNEMDRAWLRELPFHRRVSPTTNPHHDLLVVHANPRDVNQLIYPPESRQEELYGEVKQTDRELRPILKDTATGVLAFGHLHVPNVRHWNDITLANISSVSLPLDGDTRAKYGLLTWEGSGVKAGKWIIRHRYVEYALQPELDLYAEKKMPDWENLQNKLQTAQ